MLPPEFEFIANELQKRYRTFLEDDREGEKVPDFLSAEEQVMDFVYSMALQMLQTFADVRTAQARADPG